MSLANEASLLLIPSGYKSGKVYSVFPTDGDGDFTFTRGSDGTRVGAGGLVETMSSNIPRLDYLNSDCPSLLLQPQRTNLNTYSESSTGKTTQNLTLTDNNETSPNGEFNAIKVTDDTVNFRHRFWANNVSVTSGTQYTISFYVKKNSPSRYIYLNAGILGTNGSFSLDNQSTTGSVQVFESLDNDWYRIGLTGTAPTTTTSVYFIQMQLGTSDASYIGDGSSFYFWGLQMEQGSYPTSYIKTTSGTVTRQKDFIDDAGSSSLFNSLESTFFVEMASFLNAQTGSNGIELADISGQNRITLQYDTTNNQIRCDVRVLNSAQAIITTQSFDVTNFNKMAITYKLNEVKFYVNGQLISTDTSVNLFAPNTLTEVRSTIAGISGGAFNLQAKIKDLRVYDRVLTQAEAIQLTTL